MNRFIRHLLISSLFLFLGCSYTSEEKPAEKLTFTQQNFEFSNIKTQGIYYTEILKGVQGKKENYEIGKLKVVKTNPQETSVMFANGILRVKKPCEVIFDLILWHNEKADAIIKKCEIVVYQDPDDDDKNDNDEKDKNDNDENDNNDKDKNDNNKNEKDKKKPPQLL